jgi:DNA mismatch repair ATPase MutS
VSHAVAINEKLKNGNGNVFSVQKSLKNLDIISTSGMPSLFTVLDKTSSAMGKRLLHTW